VLFRQLQTGQSSGKLNLYTCNTGNALTGAVRQKKTLRHQGKNRETAGYRGGSILIVLLVVAVIVGVVLAAVSGSGIGFVIGFIISISAGFKTALKMSFIHNEVKYLSADLRQIDSDLRWLNSDMKADDRTYQHKTLAEERMERCLRDLDLPGKTVINDNQ
jgi:hypothetical protein